MSGNCLQDVDVAILAGGLGTRLQGVLEDTPKILAPVGGRPFLAFLFDWLGGCGAKRVVLGLGHLADVVVAYLDGAPPPGIEVVPVIEPEPLGTAGGLRLMRPSLLSDPVMVMNGDTFVGADICAFVDHHARSAAEASLLCTEVDDAARYGRVTVSADGRIEGFEEKDAAHRERGLINAGLYLFGAAMLERIGASTGPSLERDVFPSMPPGSLDAVAGRFPFIDIGTPADLAAAPAILGPYLRS